MDFSKTLFRCSSIGHLMTEPRSKSAKEAGELSEGAKTHIIDVYVSRKYGRQTEIFSKYLEKGISVEEESITLYSRYKKEFFRKNEEHLTNDYLMGTPDLFKGPSIQNADHIVDIKSSWDLFTFSRVRVKEINDLYYWQLMGYMALSGAKSANLGYCLVNTPEFIIEDEKRKLMWNMRAISEYDPAYMEAAAALEKERIFDDIPLEEKVIEIEVPRNDEEIERIYKKVERARVFLQELEEKVSYYKRKVA